VSTVSYMCPKCGAPLAFSGETGKLECASCSTSYETEALEALNTEEKESKVAFDRPTECFSEADEAEIKTYTCENCGAELLTSETTTATECPYCGSPTVLPDRIAGGVKPEMVIPFKIKKEEAEALFHGYFKGKALMPNIFLQGRNRISEIRKLYVPYWLFDCSAEASVSYDARKVHTRRSGDWEITETDHYFVRRAGEMAFEGIPVDGSEKLDNKITESLEPYDIADAIPFRPQVLAGAMADHADVDSEACEARAAERVEESIVSALRDTVHGYSSVSERSRRVYSEGGKITPVLMPVWMITTEKEGKTYTFAINGQTGKLTCDVPADVKKSILWGGGTFAGVFGIGMLILWLAEALSGGAAMIAGVLSLIIALIVYAVLHAQLKQASFESDAGSYIVKDSFRLHTHTDFFLYRTVRRRKIETEKKN